MADDEHDAGDTRRQEEPPVPPLTDVKNPFADDTEHDEDDDPSDWVPPVP
jgi:hypothetical protein